FADSQKKSRGEEAADASGRGRTKGRNTPQESADSADPGHPKAIQHDPDRQLQQAIRPVIGAQQIAEGYNRDSELGVECVLADGQIDTIKIIDENAETQQPRNSPTPARYFQTVLNIRR